MAVGDMGQFELQQPFSVSGCAEPPPLPGEVARRSRDGEVAANLRQPLSQPVAASSLKGEP